MDTLAVDLAREARNLKLDVSTVHDCHDKVVRAFAEVVLAELAARGLLDTPESVGCWARARSTSN